MPEIGQTSHTVEEVEIRDIPVDTERLIGYAPVAPVQSESEEDEDVRADIPEAVGGGVFRFDGEDEDEDDDVEEAGTGGSEEAAEADPEELAVEPDGYHDDMGTTSDDIIEELTTHNAQLEDRIAHLEEQNAVHQEREDQYRDLAYQREAENAELRQQLQQLRAERDVARTEWQALGERMLRLRADRDAHYDAGRLATTRSTDLEAEVRTYASRIDRDNFTLDTAFGRLRSRIRRYPREEDMSRRSIPRRIVDLIARQEHEEAILRRGG